MPIAPLQHQEMEVVPIPTVGNFILVCNHVALYGLKIFLLVLVAVILFGRVSYANSERSRCISNSVSSTTSSRQQSRKQMMNVGSKTFMISLWPLIKYVSTTSSSFSTLFLQWHGWSHRLAGGTHLCWMILGTFYVTQSGSNIDFSSWKYKTFAYDVVLGVLGVITTYTASQGFPHKTIQNNIGQSGTLHLNAIVTQAEMIEHLFYQFLNLCQSIYLHTLSYYYSSYYSGDDPDNITINMSIVYRLSMLWLVTSPWLVRHKLPVHSFSHNWLLYQQQRDEQKQRSRIIKSQLKPKEEQTTSSSQDQGGDNNDRVKLILGQRPTHKSKISGNENDSNGTSDSNNSDSGYETETEVLLYRIKKCQYIFYKHVILHGVNIYSMICIAHNNSSSSSRSSSSTIPYSTSWRIFWLLLNLSYVMEFFLQSIVKRRIISQSGMLYLQRWLMSTASISAICVLLEIPMTSSSSLVAAVTTTDSETTTSATYTLSYASFWLVCVTSLILNFVHRHHDVMNTMVIGIVLLLTTTMATSTTT